MVFTIFDPLTDPLTGLVQGFLASNSGISVVDSSINLHLSGAGAVSLYDASVGTPLGIGSGLLLTSGITPGTSNTSTGYGADNSGTSGFYNGDPDIDAVVNTVFQTQSYDATTLAFSFNLSDPKATSISFDLVFGSDEYPEWVDAFVDCAVVIVDGVNYALFNNDPLHPLSVISPNLTAGYFQDNAGNVIPIEYDGVSGRLTIVAPLNTGLTTHTIKIGIADTGDHILDSGLFIANMSAGTNPGSGVVSNPGGGTSGNDSCLGSSKDEFFNLLAGDDTVYAGGGADIIVAGSGNDQVFAGSGNDDLKGDAGNDLLDGGADVDTAVYSGASNTYQLSYDSLTGQYSINDTSQLEGFDTLLGIEKLQFSDGLFSLSNNGLAAVLTPVTQPVPQPTNTPGVVMVSGLAAVGYTLKATLADADGLPNNPGAITWQWYSDAVAISGATASEYVVQATDTNATIWVEASYSDAKGQGELAASNGVTVQPLSDGDLQVTLMTIEGPASASVNTPLTTLLLRAVELGETPNSAIQKIRATLGVPAAVSSLLTTNAFQILQTGVGDTTTAMALARLEVEVAVLCSLSDDQSGLKLTLALLDKASSGSTYDLTQAADLAEILGLDTATFNLADKGTYPQPLKEIVDRTNNISDATHLLGSTSSIEQEWQDFLSNWDSLADTVPLSTLSQAINQGPSGFATADLPCLVAGEEGAFTLTTALLITGFHDPDNDTLTVSGLTTDQGNWFSLNADGSWTVDPSTYDPNYRGPLELSYWVNDGHGHSLAATQLLVVVDHPNQAPTGGVTLSGIAAQGQALTADVSTLADADGLGTISYQWHADGNPISGATDSTYVLSQTDVGKAISVTASYTDGFGQAEAVSSAASAAVANIDDTATGNLSVSGTPAEGSSLSATFSNASDPDGAITSTSFRWQEFNGAGWADLAGQSNVTLAIPSDQSYVGKTVRVVVTTTDILGGSTTFTGAEQTIANVNDLPTGGVTISGIATQGQTLTADVSTLADADGLGTISYQWNANGSAISSANGSTYVLSQTDVGKAISVTASYTDGFGQAEAVSSLATNPVTTADSTAPTLNSVSLSGTVISLSFSEQIASTGLPPASAFKVETISGTTPTTRTISSVALDSTDTTGRRLLLTLSGTAPASNIDLRVSYTDPTGNQTTGVVQDLAGNDLASFANQYASTLYSSTSVTSLAANYRDLFLTGTAATGTGNANANTITGNASANSLNGGAGGDVLTGGLGNDIFRLTTLSDSLLGNYDRITDFVIGSDSIDGPTAVTATKLRDNAGTVSTLTQAGIQSVLTSQTFVRNGAATFTYGTQTFLALNDGTAGFSAATDAIIEITGYSGSLTNLAVI